ncbi:hypothetical protein C5Q97_14825 [Victivallales bacterium CCUG 44730]|nr:hypothetical protein C5Q97_14825 [Victivallales bacterium CCUG 44730]
MDLWIKKISHSNKKVSGKRHSIRSYGSNARLQGMTDMESNIDETSSPFDADSYPPETEWEVHPAAKAFPMQSEDEFRALCEDIRTQGQREPIKVCRGLIIDGRNRYRACKELGLTIKAEEVDIPEEKIVEYVFSLNLSRRHLNPGQRAVIALKDWDRTEAESLVRKQGKGPSGKNSPRGKTPEILARKYSVNAKYIQWAKEIQTRKPELLDGIFDGTKQISQVYAALKTNPSLRNVPKVNIPEFIFRKLITGTDVKELLPHMPKQAQKIAEKVLGGTP